MLLKEQFNFNQRQIIVYLTSCENKCNHRPICLRTRSMVRILHE